MDLSSGLIGSSGTSILLGVGTQKSLRDSGQNFIKSSIAIHITHIFNRSEHHINFSRCQIADRMALADALLPLQLISTLHSY